MNSKPDQASEGRIPAITARLEKLQQYSFGKTIGVHEYTRDVDYLLDQVRVLTQEIAVAHARLDDVGAPKGDGFGVFTLAGRIEHADPVEALQQSESSRLLLVRQLGELQQFADAYRRENEERERLVVELQKAKGR